MKAQDLLVLSDVEFMSLVANYFRAIVEPKTSSSDKGTQEEESGSLEDTLKSKDLEEDRQQPPDGSQAVVTSGKGSSSKALPRLKAQVSVSNFRVAIIEAFYTEKPQALTLRVRYYGVFNTHIRITLS